MPQLDMAVNIGRGQFKTRASHVFAESLSLDHNPLQIHNSLTLAAGGMRAAAKGDILTIKHVCTPLTRLLSPKS